MAEFHRINPHGGVVTRHQLVAGQHTTVAAVDQIVIPGVERILSATATLNSDPGDDPVSVSATFSGATLTIKTWKNASGTDPTPAAATTFGKNVSWQVVAV